MRTKNVFELALLSEAAYADLRGADTRLRVRDALQRIGNAAGEPNDPDLGFSPTQAEAFTRRWRVIDHQPNTGSGYSGTLFERLDNLGNGTGEHVLALRGTEGLFSDDMRTNIGDIVSDGLAIEQIVDLYNHWQRISHAGVYRAARLETLAAETTDYQLARVGQFVPAVGLAAEAYLAQLRAREDVVIDEPFGIVRKLDLEDSDELFGDERATGLGLAIGAGPAVTGHSLGGHLASAFTRLFPGTGAEALTVNGAGHVAAITPNPGGMAATNIRNLFGLLGGAPHFDDRRIVNVFGEAMPEVVAMDEEWGLVQPGVRVPVHIEQTPWYGNTLGHGVSQVTDSLAVYDLFVQLSSPSAGGAPEDTLEGLEGLFRAGAVAADETLERLVYTLGRLFQVGGTLPAIDHREALFEGVVAVRDAAAYQQAVSDGNGVVMALSAYDEPAQLVANARHSLAFRYALVNLAPFVVLNQDDVYAAHNTGGGLDLYDPATGSGALSAHYLEDRALYLSTLLARNTEGGANDTGITFLDFPEAGGGSDPATRLAAATALPRRFVFGGEGGDILMGGRAEDHLYGGGGGDSVHGGKGDDRLEGGQGADRLYGGPGNDVLAGGAGDDILLGGHDPAAGPGSNVLRGGRGRDIYFARPGDVVADSDGDGDDTLVAGWGDDRLEGGPGDDVYLWDETLALGMLGFPTGHDRIADSAGDDTVRFSTMRRYHLAFARAGDDLVIQGPGDDASLTVAAWFRDDTQRIERFTTAAGDTLVDTQVALLIQAMNQFVADDPGIDTWHQAVREHPQDTATLLAAHWEPAASMSG
ncbi:MAG: hypothetical protein U5S82_02115 [Gammaproteobacteria bacterium]|nr:hypothetical protein [Gammaproteobacteria bacterium]